MQRCNTSPRELTLRGEWNDPIMVRNKLTMDMIKSAGGVGPRIEYGRLSVNGEYFGLYTLEEHIDQQWAGLDEGLL